jgi:hypothetical protein
MQVHFVGDILDRSRAASATDSQDEPSGVAWVSGEPGEAFAFHAAPWTINAAEVELQEDRMTATIQIA